jgi:adenine-specific DNA-methyltransferase
MIYGARSSGKHHGLVLTKPIIVQVMLDRVGYKPTNDLRAVKVIEPSAGDGAFAIEIVDRLYKSAISFGFSFEEALKSLHFYEMDPQMAHLLSERIESYLATISVSMPQNLIHIEDFLLSNAPKCDLVIGNPPYVRHENIPDAQKSACRALFSTFTHRSDLYIAFYEKGLKLLTKDGALTFICSNRWLKNQYGKGLRHLIHQAYLLGEIIDLEGTCPFEEEVIAYPAITTIKKGEGRKPANYYQVNDIDQLPDLDNLVEPTRTLLTNSSANWFSYQPTNLSHTKYLDSIENQGFKIGIGVATGSDRVFIRKDFKSLVEHELLLPILLARDIKNNALVWSENYIINPFDNLGRLINLQNFPKASSYFDAHKEHLNERHVAKKNPSAWYKTIDRINTALLHQDKILLPDISGNSHLLIDRGNYYPHHNLYYITGNGYEYLVILAALLMSDLVKNQLLEIGNKMNGGYPRWQSQNLRKLRVPMINAMPIDTKASLVKAYHAKDYDTINELITENHINEYRSLIGQTALFEPESEGYLNKSLLGIS